MEKMGFKSEVKKKEVWMIIVVMMKLVIWHSDIEVFKIISVLVSVKVWPQLSQY